MKADKFIPFSTRLSAGLTAELRRISRLTGIKKQQLTEEALSAYLIEVEFIYNRKHIARNKERV